MNKSTAYLAVGAVGLLLAGCGNSTVSDLLGQSKSVPDERVVRTHQTLSVPPDLELRPPGQGEDQSGQLNPYARQAATQQYASPPGIGTVTVPSAGGYGQPSTLGLPPSTHGQQPPANGQGPLVLGRPQGQPQVQRRASGDIFQQHGISRTNPDGTEKSHGQLMKELRKVSLERKRAKNPNYGTIFHIGDLFSSN